MRTQFANMSFATCALLALCSFVSANGQTNIHVSYLPTPIKVTILTPAPFEMTPSRVQRRRLEQLAHRHSRQLLQSVGCTAYITFGPKIFLGDSIISIIGSFLGSAQLNASCTATGGRRLLASTGAPPSVTFHGEVKRDILSGNARASYLIDSSMSSFFAGLAASGSTATSGFAFLRAMLLFPQEGTDTTPPPFAESTKGFVTTDPLQPIIVKLATKGKVDTVPSIALRFDYSQTGVDVDGNAVTPFVSVMFTDYVGSYPNGLPAAPSGTLSASVNINQVQGIPVKAL